MNKPLLLNPKTLDKIARVDRLVRMGQKLYFACKTVGITPSYYQKIKKRVTQDQDVLVKSEIADSLLSGSLSYGEEVEEMPDSVTMDEASKIIG